MQGSQNFSTRYTQRNVLCQKYKGRTRKGLAGALPGSGPKLVEDADALVLQEILTRFGLNSHHQRAIARRRKMVRPAVDHCMV